MASAEFDEEALEKRPTVQVGDPFLEKLLLEACLEAMRSGAVAGIQDMGAAGLTSSSCEMAARAGTGIEIDLSLVPQREDGMTAYEMLLSESQERMLIVAHAGREREVMDIFRKWDLDAVVIGRVRDTGRMQVIHNGETVADIPVEALTDEAPQVQPTDASTQCPRTVADKVQSTTLKTGDQTSDLVNASCPPAISFPNNGSIASTITWSEQTRRSSPERMPQSFESRKLAARWQCVVMAMVVIVLRIPEKAPS